MATISLRDILTFLLCSGVAVLCTSLFHPSGFPPVMHGVAVGNSVGEGFCPQEEESESVPILPPEINSIRPGWLAYP